jgi:hypothetical protein
MRSIILEREGDRIKIAVTIDLSGAMLETEEAILQGVNAVGDAVTAEALKRFAADGDPIEIGGAKRYSKGQLPKSYNQYGVPVSRWDVLIGTSLSEGKERVGKTPSRVICKTVKRNFRGIPKNALPNLSFLGSVNYEH